MAAYHRVPQEESRSELTDVVSEALELRRWAVALLARRVQPHTAAESFRTASLDAWRLFLATEVIALPLSRRLGEASALLEAAQRATLDQAMRAELQRVMSARALLAEIDHVSVALSIAPVVLKGGATAIDGSEPVDLGDVDLLLEDDARDALGQAMLQHGFERDIVLPIFTMAGAIPVELHVTLDVGVGIESTSGFETRAIPNFARLRRGSVVAHVTYVIQHSTTHHVVRRGHLRDVVLIAGALEQSSAREVRELERALDALPMRSTYRDMLGFAQALIATGDDSPVHDPFTIIAATKYALYARWPQGTRTFPLLQHHVPFFVASSGDAWRIVHSYMTSEPAANSIWIPSTLAPHAPRLARAIATVVRAPYRLAALAAAWAVAMVIRRRYSARWSR